MVWSASRDRYYMFLVAPEIHPTEAIFPYLRQWPRRNMVLHWWQSDRYERFRELPWTPPHVWFCREVGAGRSTGPVPGFASREPTPRELPSRGEPWAGRHEPLASPPDESFHPGLTVNKRDSSKRQGRSKSHISGITFDTSSEECSRPCWKMRHSLGLILWLWRTHIIC